MSARRADGATRPDPVTIRVDGEPVAAVPGETLAAALLAAGLDGFRRDTRGRARGLFCNMGSCGECMVSVEHPVGGRRRVRACLVPVTNGLDVRRGLS